MARVSLLRSVLGVTGVGVNVGVAVGEGVAVEVGVGVTGVGVNVGVAGGVTSAQTKFKLAGPV